MKRGSHSIRRTKCNAARSAALGCSFELLEARVSAGESACYVGGTDVVAFASAIDELLRDPERRNRMGCVGRERVERELSWDTSRRNLIDFYGAFLSR